MSLLSQGCQELAWSRAVWLMDGSDWNEWESGIIMDGYQVSRMQGQFQDGLNQ